MSSTYGKYYRMITFGESHGKAVGVVIDGIKPGIELTRENIQKELDRRKPGQSSVTTQRKEEDKIEILSGVFNGKTLGTPICMVVYNKDADSGKYNNIKEIFRPGHADYTFLAKYGIRDYRGGGRASGRETLARVAAAAIAKKTLNQKGIEIISYVKEIAGIKAQKIDFSQINKNSVKCPDKDAAKKMEEKILELKKEGDSAGGIVELIVKNCPAGLGDPVFDKLNADIAKALMSIGSVKGVEIGSGFESAKLKGSENNKLKNSAGGISGGISNGEDIIARVAVKPTSSISKEQESFDIHGNMKKIKIEGRHDPCICPRIVPVVEAMVALVLFDNLLEQDQISKNQDIKTIREKIDNIDNQFFLLLANRQDLVKEISKLKSKLGKEITDVKREKEILKNKNELAKELGLDSELINKIFKSIIEYSKKTQKKIK